ncbi:MAG TPA: hypothetical protein VGK96_28365 [Candidatus Sulfotelmatobacter sp.]|jgi:hypothetical protein
MIYRVSNVCTFHRWQQMEDVGVDFLINDILHSQETEAMRKGTAFHKILEHVKVGQEFTSASQDGYTFHFTGEFHLYRPPMREVRRFKDYGGITISGQTDAFAGSTMWDDKTTERFDAENYLDGFQHRFYMDIFGADRFIWNVWEMKEMDEPRNYCVHAMHRLEQFRYPDMTEDCMNLALEFKDFALRYLENPKPTTHTSQLNEQLRASLS